METIKDNRDIYPLTIISDRYSGCYSGAKFLAFNLNRNNIPEDIGGSDPDEMCFWDTFEATEKYDTYHNYIIGKGDTVQEAFNDLYNKLKP